MGLFGLIQCNIVIFTEECIVMYGNVLYTLMRINGCAVNTYKIQSGLSQSGSVIYRKVLVVQVNHFPICLPT